MAGVKEKSNERQTGSAEPDFPVLSPCRPALEILQGGI